MIFANNKKTWYCWVVAFACMLLSAASVGMLSYFNALFFTPVSEALGVSRSSLVLYSTFSTVTTMLFLPFVGKLYQRFSMRPLIIFGACLGASAHFCYSAANTVYLFYLGGILAGLASCIFGSVPITLLLSNWFVKKRGLMTGIAFAGSGIASSLLSPVVSELITVWGWRSTYRMIATAILLTTLLSTLLIRPSPESIGALPYGGAIQTNDKRDIDGFSQKETLRLPAYWLLACAIFILGLTTMGTQPQLVSYWLTMGVKSDLAVRMYSVVLLTAVAGKIFVGLIYDQMDVPKASSLCFAILASSFITLLGCVKDNNVFISAILFGFASSMQVILPAYLVQKLFGPRDYVSNVALMTTVLYMGVSVGSPSGALIYDLTGSYRLAWIVFAVLAVLAFLCVLIANRLSVQSYKRKFNMDRRP